MKKLGARLAVIGVFAMMVIGCNSSRNDSPPTNSATVGTAQNLFASYEKLHGSMTEQDVIDLVGEPTSKVALGGGDNRLEYLDPDGGKLTATFTNGKLTAYTFKGAGEYGF